MSTNFLLLDVVPCICSGEYWKGVIQNGIGCALGSFLSIYAAILIYRNQIDRDDAIRKGIENQRERDVLMFFKYSVESGINIAQQQRDNLTQLMNKIREDKIYFHMLTTVPFFELKRIISSYSLNETMVAYATKFRNTEKPVKEFQNIIAGFDYLYLSFQQMPQVLERAQRYDYKRKEEYRMSFKASKSLVKGFLFHVGTQRNEFVCSQTKVDLLLDSVS